MCLSIHCNHGLTRRGALKTAAGFAALAGFASVSLGPASAKEVVSNKPKPNAISGDEALRRLMAGNARYAANKPTCRDLSIGRVARIKSQYPIAAVLSCADSRVAPEFAFDQGLGKLFVVRLAGNFADDDGLASLEYAVKFLGVPLVLVLGHSNCGAVHAAVEEIEDNVVLPGHLPGLVQSIKPAVEAAKAKSPNDLLAAAIRENVLLNVKRLETAQPLLASFVQNGQLKITGGVYNLANGKVGLLS
ncbi:MAG TPA: carbonic anhydrase [Methylocella sp.]|nr:carbonic anhydrase [Methylocella sp.]